MGVDGQSYTQSIAGHRIATSTVYNDGDLPDMFEPIYSGGATNADVTLRHLCIKSSYYPVWDKKYGSFCYVKQNFVAETMTALKSFEKNEGGHDTGGDPLLDDNYEGKQKNVRFSYIKVDANGASVDIELNDDDYNYYPVGKTEFIQLFVDMENEECGSGTNDIVDLCAGIDAALDQFASHRINPAESVERERKIAIISNNQQKDNLQCSNGQNICDKYGQITLGQEGISIVMINIDMNGSADEYLPCLTYYEQPQNVRIQDYTSEVINGEDERDILIEQVHIKLCETEPTLQPTTNPTLPPSPSPTDSPTPSPTDIPTKNPTRSPTKPPTKNPTLPPTPSPTDNPTKNPTRSPTKPPTKNPTLPPTKNPTLPPTPSPTGLPTPSPTDSPT